MIEEIKAFIVEELEKKAPLPGGVNLDDYDYLRSGHIDSMGTIKFILSIEDRFGVEMTTEDIESPGFGTVGGLASLISSKLCAG